MFALRCIPEGGCILADEVGLGKTIEAGLVVAQLLAEGASRMLIIVPRSLLGQWQDELYTLFGIVALEAADPQCDMFGPGVFLVGREYAGSVKGSQRLAAATPFNLCLIDEAHEIFAGIYKRFDNHGVYDEGSREAQTAHRVLKLIGPTPVLLLTATPLQNSLAELWGLLHYIERSGTLLGSFATFKTLFCEKQDGRRLVPEQGAELKRRLGAVVQRTLRRQAQEFLDKPFVGRRAELYEYSMSPEEKTLYDDVTAYLLTPSLCAFQGRSRLVLLHFHRLMASSTAALAKSLERVAARLRTMQAGVGGHAATDAATALLGDLEDDGLGAVDEDEHELTARPEAVAEELARVEAFVRRAHALPHDSKAQSLVKAVRTMGDRRGVKTKLVVFTESLTTQEYLRGLLVEKAGLDNDEITLFRGTNDSPRAQEALQRWREEVGTSLPPTSTPSPSVAVRLALVHEFRTRSRVFIATEAGAKGLNLQFCDTVINYDLPWNPQRIEQRIGRCHRYGQERDVTVINFLARGNEAQRLTLEILTQKLDLFGNVLDMSDDVLHAARSDRSEALTTALGPDFEKQLHRIWDRARSVDEVEEELRRLRESMEESRQELAQVQARTTGLIESRLDDSVQQVFRKIADELPATLAELDADLERVVVGYLHAQEVPHTVTKHVSRKRLKIPASPLLPGPLSAGLTVAMGRTEGLQDGESLHVAHPLVLAALNEARAAGRGHFSVRFRLTKNAPEALRNRSGARGRLALTRVLYRGFEREDRLVATALFDDAEVLRPAEAALELVQMPCEDISPPAPALALTPSDLDEVVDEELFFDQADASRAEHDSFERTIDQLDQYMEDRLLVLRRTREDTTVRLHAATAARDAALGSDLRAQAEGVIRRLETELEELEVQIGRLVARDDDDYRKWKAHAHQRRYEPPQVERLFSLEFVIA